MGTRLTELTAEQKHYLEKAYRLVDQNRLVDLLVNMINIPSRTGEEEDLARFMVDYIAGLGLEAFYQHMSERRGNAIGRLRGSGSGPTLMFNGHLDTSWTGVEVEDYPMTGPLPPALRPHAVVEDGWVKGLGARNMKGPDACTVMAVDAVKRAGAPLKGDVLLTLVSGEIQKVQIQAALHSYSGRHFMGEGIGCDFMLKHGVQADFAINVEPGHPVSYECTGLCWFKVQAKGRMTYAGVAGTEPTAKNAIVEMSKLAIDLDQWGREYTQRHARDQLAPTVTIGAIEAGWPFKPGMMPGICNLYVDVRTLPEQRPLEVEREFAQALEGIMAKHPGLEVEYELYLSDPASRTDPDNWIVQSLIRGYEHVSGQKHVYRTRSAGANDCNVLRRWGIPTAQLGPGAPSVAEGGPPYHVGEWSHIQRMVNVTKMYIHAIIDTCMRARAEVGLG